MGWFSERKKEGSKMSSIPSLDEPPSLPELPRLPSLPNSEFEIRGNVQEKMQPLPSLPSNSLGNRFSQNMIKEAVSDEEGEDSEDTQENFQQSPGFVNSYEREAVPFEFREAAKKVKRLEPIFVRLDKFEDSLENFEKIKQQIAEIKSILREIKEKKSQEEQELTSWDSELQSVKNQLEKIDADLFSKIE